MAFGSDRERTVVTDPQHILPIDGKQNEIKIMQGWDGPWSHKNEYPRPNQSLFYSVDFEVPFGTVVYAARAGIVRILHLRTDECIEDPDPDPARVSRCNVNYAVIQADDGTHDFYLHLQKQSGLVLEKESVVAGQPLCSTGKSGWVGDVPHLHFHVFQSRELVTIPFGFKDYPHSLWHEDKDKR